MAESSRFASSVNDATLNSLDSFASRSAISWGIRVWSDWATARASTVETAGDAPVSSQVSQALNQEHNSLQYSCTCNIVYMYIRGPCNRPLILLLVCVVSHIVLIYKFVISSVLTIIHVSGLQLVITICDCVTRLLVTL